MARMTTVASARPLALDPDRLLPVEPGTREIARRLLRRRRRPADHLAARSRPARLAGGRHRLQRPDEPAHLAGPLRLPAAARAGRPARRPRRRWSPADGGPAPAARGASSPSTGSPSAARRAGSGWTACSPTSSGSPSGWRRRAPTRSSTASPRPSPRRTSAPGHSWTVSASRSSRRRTTPSTTCATTAPCATTRASPRASSRRSAPTATSSRAAPDFADLMTDLARASAIDTGQLRRLPRRAGGATPVLQGQRRGLERPQPRRRRHAQPRRGGGRADLRRCPARRREPERRPPPSAVTCSSRWRACRPRTDSS